MGKGFDDDDGAALIDEINMRCSMRKSNVNIYVVVNVVDFLTSWEIGMLKRASITCKHNISSQLQPQCKL